MTKWDGNTEKEAALAFVLGTSGFPLTVPAHCSLPLVVAEGETWTHSIAVELNPDSHYLNKGGCLLSHITEQLNELLDLQSLK